MVMAKLHMICGNCGCNDNWIWHYVPQENYDESGSLEVNQVEDVFLICKNCSTLHCLNDTAKKEEELE